MVTILSEPKHKKKKKKKKTWLKINEKVLFMIIEHFENVVKLLFQGQITKKDMTKS